MTAPLASNQGSGTPDDASLVARVAATDAGALETLYARYGRPCYSLARRILAEDTLAQEVVQEVFLVLWRDPRRFDPSRGSFASWLLAMTHHKAVDVVRREETLRRRRTGDDVLASLEAESRPVPEEVWAGFRREQVRTALKALPDPQREALALAYFGGYTQREIAALTKAPLGTVKTRMLLGMRRLRDALPGLDPRDAQSGEGAVS